MSSSSSSSIIVPSYGRSPNPILLCGESPGRDEARLLRPFAGKSGLEQKHYLAPHKLNPDHWYLTNVVKLYQHDNPDPTPELIQQFTPELIREVHQCNPRLIIAVGRFAIQWFLGDDADLESCHGLVHRPGHFDQSIANRCPSHSIVLPIYHPAAGFYKDKLRPIIQSDYRVVADVVNRIRSNEPIIIRNDNYHGREQYHDVTGKQLVNLIGESFNLNNPLIALDTEGIPSSPWSLQVSWEPGTAYTLRCSQPDFQHAINALQSLADNGVTFTTHDASTPMGCLYDMTMCDVMGLNLSRAKLFNTMYASYLFRLEPKGLKPLSYRFNAMQMEDYPSLIAGIAKQKQLDYLINITTHKWPKPEPRLEHANDGTSRLKTYQPIATGAQKIIVDIITSRETKDGPTNPYKRWYDLDPIQLKLVESKLGPMPTATLDDIYKLDPQRAIHYASRDADATFRLIQPFIEHLTQLDLLDLFNRAMSTIPIFWEMQQNGMPADRTLFAQLEQQMSDAMSIIGDKISTKYFSSRPFNPKSPVHVRTLLQRRGLKASKKTNNGDDSTGKKSIEHLRFVDPAIELMFDWREHQHIKDSFCLPILDIIPEHIQHYNVRSNLRIADTGPRRLASTDPNLLNIPVRKDIGRAVRSCYALAKDSNQVLYGADLSQIELRVLADESNSKFLIERFLTPKADPHRDMAMRVFGITNPADVDEFKHRLPAKTTIYGIIFGQQGQGLSDQLRMLGLTGWDVKSCTDLKNEVFKILGINEYIDNLVRYARRKGYIRTCLGMYRYFPDLNSNDYSLRSEAERQVVSHRISGTAQDMIQEAMRNLRPTIWSMVDSGLDVKWRLQVHDELIFSCTEDIVDTLGCFTLNAMSNMKGVLKMKVPVVAKGHVARDWGELK